MTTPGPEGHGLGTAIESLSNLPWTSIGHTGGIPGYSTALIVVPEHQTAVCVLLPHHSDAHYIARMLLMVLLTE
ncbi:MAG: beta-lactamase family protein [Actinobacteria bacterium]|nr:beta-lactamase family protein [Actinomycetota bacterium]